MNRVATARENMEQGRYNCSQSVATAYAAEAGLDPDSIVHLAFPFGGGFARQGYVCGAISGAVMILAAKYGKELGSDPNYRDKMYTRAGELAERFRLKNSAILCKELLGYDLRIPEEAAKAREEGIFKTKCPLLVESAAEILEEFLKE